MDLFLANRGINKRESKNTIGDLAPKPYPFLLKLLFAFRDNFVLILVRKKVRAHGASGLSQKLMGQTLWKQ